MLTFHHYRLRPRHLCSRWAPLAVNKYQIRILNQYLQYHDVNILNISTLVIGFTLEFTARQRPVKGLEMVPPCEYCFVGGSESAQGYKPVGLVDWLVCQLGLKLVSGLEGQGCLHLK